MLSTPEPQAVQAHLGDDDAVDARLARLQDDVSTRLATLGNGGIQKPKDILKFVDNLAYKAVGGQQLECDCMFCGKHLISTGATKVVDHYKACGLCPAEVKSACIEFRNDTAQKRKAKDEHQALVLAEEEQRTLREGAEG